MATTTNFGWETPDDTDLVKDGAAAMRTLGNSIDTSFVDLKGGTTGQVLSKASGTDLDFTWVAQDDSNAIQNAIVDAKGDLIAATAADTPARLAVGTNGQVLTADSTASTGIKWASPASSGMNLIVRTTFSNVGSQAFDNVFTSTYTNYLVVIDEISAVSAGDDLQMQFRYAGPTTQSSLYYGSYFAVPFSGSTSVGQTNNQAAAGLAGITGSSTYKGSGNIYFSLVGNATEYPTYHGQYVDSDGNQYIFGGQCNSARIYTGFLLKSASTNITGAVSIYGLAKA